ncbi:MAG: polysaccharide pyruvyl transferase family protein [Polaromonas sp.]|nr:polysaccharide pyruvyl transferase family protein [Polaromonas sp.]
MNPFLFGFSPSVEDSALISTERAMQMVGDNTGNLAFCYAINRQLGGNLKSILWNAPSSEIEAMGTIGVLTLANQLGSHANLGYLADSFSKLKANLVGIGLGAQAGHAETEVQIPEGTLNWIRAIQNRSPSSAPNIGMRGEFSKRALEKYGLADKVAVLGCPTLFISPDKQLGKTIVDRFHPNIRHVAVAAGHQRWTHLSRIEASLVQIAQTTGGAYICQSPLEMIRLGRGESASMDREARDACRSYAAPCMSDEEFIQWCDQKAISFFSANAWIEHLKRFDFVVGTRIHGVMLALQAGIPALCIAHDSRTIELCQTMLVPYIRAQDVSAGITRDALSKNFKFDPEAFDVNRKILASHYVKFLTSNGLAPASYLNFLTT